ncbi:hypothetical protein Tco_1202049 [Tanacetum coccineum]
MVKNMFQHEPHFILEVFDNGFDSLVMRACVFLRSKRVFNPKELIKSDGIEWWWHLYGGDGGRRDKVILHMLCILDGFLDVLVKGVKLVKFVLYLVFSHGWLGLSTQPTPREVDRWESWFKVHELEKVKALRANGDMSGSRVGVVWMEVDGGIVREKVVSRVVLGLVVMGLRDWKCHIGTLGHTHHSVGDVVGKVEGFSNGEAVEHVAQTTVRMVLVLSETYGIFTQDDFPFLEIDFQLRNNHLKRIKDGINPFHLSGLGLSSFLEQSIMDQR